MATDTNEKDTNVASIQSFRASLSEFKFSGSPSGSKRPTQPQNGGSSNIDAHGEPPESPSTTKLRRSPRKHKKLVAKSEDEHHDAEPNLRSAADAMHHGLRKRSVSLSLKDSVLGPTSGTSPSRRRLKTKIQIKRGFAPPDMYAHLLPLQDYLQGGLDVMFCGINPGEKSAILGHHFANPTNHFWRCLAGSGLTDRLLPPSEDFTLPERYNLGLTNLVDRPSKQETELAPAEFTAGVPMLLQKIARFRPRMVCFVGKGIWDAFERALPPNEHVPGQNAIPTPSLSPSPSKGKTGKRKATAQKEFQWDIQPYKLVHPDVGEADIRETLFFVTPSTSGRVTSHQLPQKTALFALLKERVEEGKRGDIDTDFMTVISAPASP